jgi:hypothetical protein
VSGEQGEEVNHMNADEHTSEVTDEVVAETFDRMYDDAQARLDAKLEGSPLQGNLRPRFEDLMGPVTSVNENPRSECCAWRGCLTEFKVGDALYSAGGGSMRGRFYHGVHWEPFFALWLKLYPRDEWWPGRRSRPDPLGGEISQPIRLLRDQPWVDPMTGKIRHPGPVR